MKRFFSFNKSKYAVLVFLILVFAVMLAFNCMTPYLADDYGYRYSFADATPIVSIKQIPLSMYHHSTYMNGRVISHGFEQLFMLMPKIVFNVVNSLVFVLCAYIVYRMIMPKGGHNLCLQVALVIALWLFTPAFGQVYLWQVGAVNYLWAMFFAMVFLYPYVTSYRNDAPFLKNNVLFYLFCPFAVVLGMYSEIASFIAIMIAIGLVFIGRVIYKQKAGFKSIVPIICAMAGFVMLLMMPVELSAKVSGELGIGVLIVNFVKCTMALGKFFALPIGVWVCLFVIRLYMKNGYKTLFLSLLLTIGALCATYVMIIGSYIPERSLFMTAILIIMASMVLLPDILKAGYSAAVSALGALMCVVFMFSFVNGAVDIYNCYNAFKEREEIITAEKAVGNVDLVVPLVHPKTVHSPFWGVVDLNCTDTQGWPNVAMSWYYGINSILGYE